MTRLKNIHPGEILKEEFLVPMGISAYRLSKETGLSQTRLSQILKEDRGITAETALKLEDCPALVDAWAEAALKVNKDVIVLVHGGPVAMPDDAAFVMNETKLCHGFYGASSMERLPTEVALTEQTRRFKSIGAKQKPAG